VLPAKMNPDLAMGDELLKKTGAGNLFVVFGEPDVEIKRRTGKSSPRSKAWMCTTRPRDRFAAPPLTTSPAGSSIPITTAKVFFVRHAYFTGRMTPTTNSSERYD
jgi:adenine-specific DNA-methyltransferase